jgi:hypothetical protein
MYINIQIFKEMEEYHIVYRKHSFIIVILCEPNSSEVVSPIAIIDNTINGHDV